MPVSQANCPAHEHMLACDDDGLDRTIAVIIGDEHDTSCLFCSVELEPMVAVSVHLSLSTPMPHECCINYKPHPSASSSTRCGTAVGLCSAPQNLRVEYSLFIADEMEDLASVVVNAPPRL